MVRVFLFLAILLLSLNAFGQHTDTLYVWAKNGLKLRAEPNAKAETIDILSYGTALHTLRTPGNTHDSVKVIPAFKMNNGATFRGFYLKDFWIKIEIGDTEGYVFGGYVSNLRPFKEKPRKVNYQATLIGLSVWIEQNATLIDSISIKQNGSYGWDSVSKIYSNHVVEQISGVSDGAVIHTVRYIFPQNFNFKDGFILMNYFQGFDLPDASNSEAEYYLYASAGQNLLSFVVGNGYSELIISYENGVLILTINSGSC